MYNVAHVVVPVCRFIAARWNQVTIQIENFVIHLQAIEPGFLFGFAQRYAWQIVIAIGVTTQLQPPRQFAVVRKQHTVAIRTYQPGRAGEVACRVLA